MQRKPCSNVRADGRPNVRSDGRPNVQEYRSIATQHDARELISKLDVKKSNFLAYGAHVTSKDEARAFCAQVAKMHHDARHVCFAWVLADGAYQFSDDGEPAQTAGLPLYTLLQHQHMKDVALCVVRYFGGILLGTGGLTRAYTEAAQLALRTLEQAGALSEWRLVQRLHIVCSYALYNQVRYCICSNKGSIEHAEFLQDVHITVRFTCTNVSIQAPCSGEARCSLNEAQETRCRTNEAREVPRAANDAPCSTHETYQGTTDETVSAVQRALRELAGGNITVTCDNPSFAECVASREENDVPGV
ncbi:IMPACT family protein [Eggerthellaceae bacterium PR-HUZ602407-17]